jgi:hypothetical protein
MVVEPATWHGTRKRRRTKQSNETPPEADMTSTSKRLRDSLECEGSNENRIISRLEDATKQLHDYYGEHLNADVSRLFVLFGVGIFANHTFVTFMQRI